MSTDIELIVTVTAGDVLFGLAWFTEEIRKGVLEPNYSILKLLPAVRQTQNTGIVTIMIALAWHKQWRRQTQPRRGVNRQQLPRLGVGPK